MGISVKKMEEYIESIEVREEIKIMIGVVLAAINDWPYSISTFEMYESQISSFIGEQATSQNIQKKLKDINILENAWEAESLSQILKLFSFYKTDLSLKEIIQDIETKV